MLDSQQRYGEDGVVRFLNNDIKISSVGGDMKCSHNLSQVTISQLQPQHCSITQEVERYFYWAE